MPRLEVDKSDLGVIKWRAVIKHRTSKNDTVFHFGLSFIGVFLLIQIMANVGKAANLTQTEKAERVDAILQSSIPISPTSKPLPKNSTINVTQDELNAYITVEYVNKSYAGLKSTWVQLLDGNRVVTDAVVNVDTLRTDNSLLLKMLTAMFSGNKSLHAEAKLVFKNNKVTYNLERASVNNITVPNFLVEGLIKILPRKQTQKIDVTKPLPLLAPIKHVEIRQGLLIIQT